MKLSRVQLNHVHEDYLFQHHPQQALSLVYSLPQLLEEKVVLASRRHQLLQRHYLTKFVKKKKVGGPGPTHRLCIHGHEIQAISWRKAIGPSRGVHNIGLQVSIMDRYHVTALPSIYVSLDERGEPFWKTAPAKKVQGKEGLNWSAMRQWGNSSHSSR